MNFRDADTGPAQGEPPRAQRPSRRPSRGPLDAARRHGRPPGLPAAPAAALRRLGPLRGRRAGRGRRRRRLGPGCARPPRHPLWSGGGAALHGQRVAPRPLQVAAEGGRRAAGRGERIEWRSAGPHRDLCLLKGKLEDDCQNYIRVLAKIEKNKILVCGTNSYKPLCRYYAYKDGEYKMDKEYEGTALCPYDPEHNSTAIYSDGQLYAATAADFSGGDPLIYRNPLRTERADLKQLNGPNFVSTMSYGKFIYFFFRETAVEYINCGKAVYSRVARVCKQDKGGPHQFGDRWTSFLKSRLNCSVPGDYPFYFNEIQSMSPIIEGRYAGQGEELLYGVFTTPVNSIGGSAVCAFRMRDVIAAFDGPFKEQETMNANWLPVQAIKVPEPRPGQCVNDSRTMPDVAINFVKSHTLMDQAVPAFFGKPLLIRISLQYRLTMIAVDPQVRAPDNKAYDVLFIGTDDGKVIKALNTAAPRNNTVETVVVEEIQVLPAGVPVKNLHVVHLDVPHGQRRTHLDDKLVVVSDDEIMSIRLHRCDSERITSCSECVALQDPYCAWDTKEQRCVSRTGDTDWNKKIFIQNVERGFHHTCGPSVFVPQDSNFLDLNKDGEMNQVSDEDTMVTTPPACPICPLCPICTAAALCSPPVTATTSSGAPFFTTVPKGAASPAHTSFVHPSHGLSEPDIHNEIVIQVDERNIISDTLAGISQAGSKMATSQERSPFYSVQTLGIAVALAVLAALVVGFVAGFLFSRRCRSDEYADMPFPDQRHQLNRLTDSSLNPDSSAYLAPCANNKAINLVLNVPPKNANGKNANSSAENKPIQKVKKTYI
ncbi:semaphorin-1A-like [Thrips palmi]|uniref:Semaphorin-1A n=1 Tax=Thrips palmi TaxID=161013 RepID=A0A6P8ZR20_THRPL|nr:semaphorin-1A-like [Thrips palmi]